jgi:hypothetical protein
VEEHDGLAGHEAQAGDAVNRRVLALVVVTPAALALVCPVHRSAQAAFPFPGGDCASSGPVALVSLTDTGTGGGSVFATGTGLAQSSFWIPGSPPTQIPVASSTNTTATLSVPALSAGSYGIIASGRGCGGNYYPGLLTVAACATPSALWGTDLKGRYIAKHALCSGTCGATGPYVGNCTSGQVVAYVCDETGNGNHLAMHGECTMNVGDPNFTEPGTWTIHMPASSSDYGEVVSFALGSAGTGLWFGSVTNPTTVIAGGNYFAEYYTSGLLNTGVYGTGGTFQALTGYSSTIALSAGSVPVGTPVIILGGTNNSTLSVSLNGETPVTASFSSTPSASAPLYVSLYNTSVNDWSGDWAELDVIDRAATTGEAASFVACQNLTYGVTQAPTVASVTPALSSVSGACATISGANFEPGISFSASGGVGALTVIASGTTWAQVTIPATLTGTYDVTALNPDGLSTTTPGALTVSPTVTVENTLCTLELAHYEAQYTCTGGACGAGSSVSAWLDYSGLGNHALQATPLDQPTVFSLTDTDFLGHPSLVSPGSPVFLQTASPMVQPSLPTSIWLFAVLKVSSLAATNGIAWYHGGTRTQCNVLSAGTPETLASATAIYSTSIGFSTAYVVCRQSAAVTTGVNVNNGVETTVASGGYSYANDYLEVMATSGSPHYFVGKMAFVVLAGGDPSPTQLATLNTYVQKFGFGL